MTRFISLQILTMMLSSSIVGCGERRPSKDIFDAINRKDYLDSEVRKMITADPSLVSARDQNSDAPLHVLAYKGRTSAVEFLLAHGADVNEPGYAGNTPLGAACGSGELPTAEVLLSHGADPNFSNEDGETPLHQIILWSPEAFDLFEVLVRAGASLDVVTKDGRSLIKFCQDRRQDYEDPNPSGSESLRRRLLAAYDRLETYILSEIERHRPEKSSESR